MRQASVEVARPSQDLQSSWGWGRQQTGKRLNCWVILTDIDKCYKENKTDCTTNLEDSLAIS